MSNADVPSTAAMLDLAMTHSLGLAMYNAVNAQQQGGMVRQASTVMVCKALLTLSPLAAGGSAEGVPADPGAAALEELAGKAEQLHAATPELAVDPQELAGKAYQSIAQSMAIAVQDAADALRNISTISTTAAGVAMAQLLATGDPKYAEAVVAAQAMMGQASENFQQIGAAAAAVLSGFPKG
jgi:hypothetical protein